MPKLKNLIQAGARVVGLAVLWAVSGSAQVEKVVADVEGITCPSCAALMEYALMRLDGIDRVTISMERQQFEVFYKLGASFQPKLLREAVGKSGVKVRKFQVQLIGMLKEQDGSHTFNSGRDRYKVLTGGPELPLNIPVYASGEVLDDTQIPYSLKMLNFRPLPRPPSP